MHTHNNPLLILALLHFAGATAAMYLAAAGYQVDVVERRGHPGQLEVDKRRTYLIGLGESGEEGGREGRQGGG